mgnify:FL=1
MSLSVNDFKLDGEYGSNGSKIEKMGKNHFKMILGTAPKHPTWTNKPQFIIKQNARGNFLRLDIEAPVEKGGDFPMTEYSYSWSYDNEHWNPIHLETDNTKFNTLYFPTFTEDRVYFGHQVPMSYKKMKLLIDKWENNKFIKKHILGKSLHDRELYRLEITDFENDGDRDKDWVHYFINIHPGEHNSQWRMVGMINWLLGKDAEEFRKNNICHFVLMASVDGPANGWYRVNQQGVDMNRSYFVEGSNKDNQAHEAYLCQSDLEEIMVSEKPVTTLWNMHTWQGAVEPIISPGPEFDSTLPDWTHFKELMIKNDPEGFIKELQNSKIRSEDNPFGMKEGWNGGPKRQFGITTVLCEGASNLYTKSENIKSGENIIKSIRDFYK